MWLMRAGGTPSLLGQALPQRAKRETALVCWNQRIGAVLVIPWVPALYTGGVTLPEKLLNTRLLTPPHRLWIKVGGGPVVAQETFAGGR